MDINFNIYSVRDKFRDLVNKLNQDFDKLKAWNPPANGGGVGIEFVDSLPSLTTSTKGRIIYLNNAVGLPDEIYVCKEDANGNLMWVQIG